MTNNYYKLSRIVYHVLFVLKNVLWIFYTYINYIYYNYNNYINICIVYSILTGLICP